MTLKSLTDTVRASAPVPPTVVRPPLNKNLQSVASHSLVVGSPNKRKRWDEEVDEVMPLTPETQAYSTVTKAGAGMRGVARPEMCRKLGPNCGYPQFRVIFAQKLGWC